MPKPVEAVPRSKVIDVVVIGAGQSGLAAGYFLKQADADFLIVDRERRVGQMWRNRYDSLVLITPRELNGLPGMLMPGDPAGRPAATEFADYLEAYARAFDLPVKFGVRVDRVTQTADGFFTLVIPNHPIIRARNVVLAFGTYPGAALPPMRKDFSPKVAQFHTYNYGNPKNVPPGTVLVAGDGAAGREIAAGLAATHEVFLATGRSRVVLPERFLGKTMWWWLEKLGVYKVRKFKPNRPRIDFIPTSVPEKEALVDLGVKWKPRLISASGNVVTFSDGSQATVRSVVWALGHLLDTRWIDIPAAKDPAGQFLMDQGVSPVPGLFFVGRPHQASASSGLIMGVGRDAEHVVGKILLQIATGRDTAPAVLAS